MKGVPVHAGQPRVEAQSIEGEFVMDGKYVKSARLGLSLCAACVLAVAANSAVAGEITGNGKILKNSDGTLNGKSECAYSGLNDIWGGDPDVPGADGFFRTQSWGQLSQATRAFLTSIGRNPGKACNPS
jgi:hypothetical protein